MNRLPRVSCLFVAYAHERYVVEALESVLAQGEDYPPELLDIVVVDDCSPDRTGELLEPYRDRVRLIREPHNRGALHATNRVIELASGELTTFISGDDVWPRGRVAAQARALADHPWAAICHADARVIGTEGEVLASSYRSQHGLYGLVGDVRGRLLEKQPICAPTVMCRTEHLKRLLPIGPPAVWNDWWMFVHAAAQGDAFCLPGVNADYRQHGQNMIHGHEGIEQARLMQRELPFRRWLLTDFDHGGIAWRDVVSAWAALDWIVGQVAAYGLGEPEELLPVDHAHRLQSRTWVADGSGADPQHTVSTLVRALAHDPWAPALRAALAAAVTRATAVTPALLIDQPVVLGLARELCWTPDLLHVFAEAWDPSQPNTLVVDAAGWSEERVGDELVPLAAEAGLTEVDGPEVVVVNDGRPWPRERLRAVLSVNPGTAEAIGAPIAGDVSGLVAATTPR
jgi:glycosyltransferase involved in cell wall biosynthesis